MRKVVLEKRKVRGRCDVEEDRELMHGGDNALALVYKNICNIFDTVPRQGWRTERL